MCEETWEPTNRVTVQHVDGEIVGRQVHGLEDLIERHHLPAHLADPHLAVRLEAFLDEPEEMFLVHAGSCMNMGVNLHNVSQLSALSWEHQEFSNLSDVVEISVRDSFLLSQLSDLVEENMKFIF